MTVPANGWVSRLGPIPNPDSPAGQLAQALRELAARKAGVDSLRAFARCINYSAPTVSAALSGDPRQVPTMDVIRAMGEACGADEQRLAQLRDMRAEAVKSRPRDPDSSRSPVPAPDPPGSQMPKPDRQTPGYRRPRWLAAAGLVLIVLGLIWFFSSDELCRGSGVTRSGQFDECVGVTDGAATFAPDLGLRTVLGRIKQENDAVVSSGAPFVSIGYVVPLPRDATSGLLTALRHELQGAYLAQWRANHHDGLGDIPLIRLLVVNVGDEASAAPH